MSGGDGGDGGDEVDDGAMGDDRDEVVYDLDDWDDLQRGVLDELLGHEGVPYRWNLVPDQEPWSVPGTSGPESRPWRSAQLVVAAGDADLVEELIDELDHPDALEVEDDDGDDGGAEVLSALYVAADILSGAPGHVQAAEGLLDATGKVGEIETPYGLDQATWAELRRLAEALSEMLREGADEEAVVEAAGALREAARPLV